MGFMMKKKITSKGIILILYIAVILLVGVVFVPSYAVWGPEKNIHSYSYVFLFDLMKDRYSVNGFDVYYQIDIIRVLFTIGIVTLITAAIWKLIAMWDQEDQKNKEAFDEL